MIKKREESENKHKKKWIIGISVIVLVIILFGLFFVFKLKGKFLDEGTSIDVSLEPNYISLRNGEKSVVEAKIDVKNSFGCNSICTYQLIDINGRDILFNKTIQIENKATKDKFEISSDNNGRGISIYSFNVECNNIESTLCSQSYEPVFENKILVMNYTISEEEERLREQTKEMFDEVSKKVENINKNISQSKFLFENILDSLGNNSQNDTRFIELWEENEKIGLLFRELLNSIESVKNMWEKEDYQKSIETINGVNITKLENISNENNNNILYVINNHNSYIEEINRISDNETINEMYSFYQMYNYSQEESKVYNYALKINNISGLLTNISTYVSDFNELNKSYNNISQTNTRNITNTNVSYVNVDLNLMNISNQTMNYSSELLFNFSFVLPEHRKLCNLDGKEIECGKNKKYPVLLVHGHSFNKKNSPDISLKSFAGIQRELEKEGYVNLGDSKINEINEDVIINFPFSLRVTYYEISLFHLGEATVTTRKSERIENYAIRLKERIGEIKQSSRSEKVVIIAHSMGGLVAREYIKLFDSNDIDNLIMIGTPNKGVKGRASDLCSVFGEEKECEDMSEGSVFLNLLNSDSSNVNNTQYFNIIGIGCETEGEDGDGVVTKENAKLSYAKSYYVNGGCSSISNPLHNELLDPIKYSKVVKIISEII